MDSTGNSLAVGKRRYRVVPLAKIVKADWNYKKEDADLTKKLIANIRRNGQVENVLVRQLAGGHYEMVNGNHRHDAFSELAVKSVLVCDLGKISKAEAMRLAIETNETAFETDFVKLSTLFKEMKGEFSEEDLLDTLPFDAREISDIEQITQFEWADNKKDRNKKANGAEGTLPMVLNFTPKQTNLINAFVTRSEKGSPEEAILWAISKVK
jgi:hypothetical protein